MNKSERMILYPILADMLCATDSDRFQNQRATQIIAEMKIDENDLEFDIDWQLWINFREILRGALSDDIDSNWYLKRSEEAQKIYHSAEAWIDEREEMLRDTFLIYADLMSHIPNDIIDDLEQIREMLNHRMWITAAKIYAEENETDTSDIISPLIVKEPTS